MLPSGRAVVGIDIGKGKHAATALSPQGEVIAQLASFPNTRQGVDQLEQEALRKAGGPGKVLVGMEATGHYWMCPYHELRDAAMPAWFSTPCRPMPAAGPAFARRATTRSTRRPSRGWSFPERPKPRAFPIRRSRNCGCWCGTAIGCFKRPATWNVTPIPWSIASSPNMPVFFPSLSFLPRRN